MHFQRIPFLTTLSLISVLFLFCACAGGPSRQAAAPKGAEQKSPASQEAKIVLGDLDEIQAPTVLKGKYDNIIIRNFKSSAQIQSDYPNCVNDCKTHILNRLQNKKLYKNVTDGRTTLPGKSAIVDLEIVDMRITSGAARFWGGAFAGSSFMDVLLQVRDGESEKIVYQQLLNTSNNAFAAAYAGGSSDLSLPADFGTLIGEYLSQLIPAGN